MMAARHARSTPFRERRPPGSDLELMRRQHLDANDVEYGMLMRSAAAAWRSATWISPPRSRGRSTTGSWRPGSGTEPRLRAGIVVPQEDAAFAVNEIERRAGDPAFVQILLSPRSSDPLGHRRYWPIFAAAERAQSSDRAARRRASAAATPRPARGWPTYYMQEHYAHRAGHAEHASPAWCSRACSSASRSCRSC